MYSSDEYFSSPESEVVSSSEAEEGVPLAAAVYDKSDGSCTTPSTDSALGFVSAPVVPLAGLQITGVAEGNEYKYDSSNILFAYCETAVELYNNGKDVLFEDFGMPQGDHPPASGLCYLDDRIINNLYRCGIRTMRPVQLAAFQATFFNNPEAIQPSDFLGISSTGSGKTHAFLVPVMMMKMAPPKKKSETPFALIFAHSNPLVDGIYQRILELVKDTGIIVKKIVGQQDFISDTYFDIAICSVGRFANHFGPNVCKVELDLSRLKYVVLDEADKMAENNEFYQLYTKMKEESTFVTMAFSATIDMSIMDFMDTDNYYQLLYGEQNAVPLSVKQRFCEVNSRTVTKIVGFATGNVRQPKYVPGEKIHPFDALYVNINRINEKGSKKRFLVFVKRQCVADFIAQKLCCYGIDAVSIYSDKKDRNFVEMRNRALGKFINGDVHVLVATQLISRGIDIEIDFVINYDLPLTYFDYIHRCGRTGRNQKNGVAISFVDFGNSADYSPRVLQKIVLNCKDPLPAFMTDFAESTKRLYEIEMEERNGQANVYN
uniref:RNA helicase n=1 Tax=Panagrolaimus davidi TaxID=227884 RepID=A0A914Q2Y5_9BILA